MRQLTPPDWLRRSLKVDPAAATCSLLGGLCSPVLLAGLQAAAAAWSDKLQFLTALIVL